MQRTLTLAGGDKLKLDQKYVVVAGFDPNTLEPIPLKTSADGALLVNIQTESGAPTLPEWDSQTVDYYSGTNNIHHVYYRTGGAAGTVVAYDTLSYVGSGVADNDQFLSSETTIGAP